MDASDVLEFLGASGEETFVELTDLIRKKRTSDAIVLVAQALADGKDVRQFMRDWVNHYRNLLMTKFIKNPQEIIEYVCGEHRSYSKAERNHRAY